ncbi:MAG: MFS transporter [Bacillota bacterium]
MKRYLILVASIAVLLCIGGIYAWSVFVPPLRTDYGLSAGQAQLIFGATIASFTISMILAGRWQEKIGPRPVAALGGLLFGGGYLLGSFSRGEFLLLLLGIGLIAGAGVGFVYVCPLATCLRWFPERKGLVTGLTVAGFGLGAVLQSAIVETLFGRGMDVLKVFAWIGWVYGALILGGASLLFLPGRPAGRAAAKAIRPQELLRRRSFWSLVAGMFAGTFAGLLVIGNLKPIGLAAGVGAHVATLAVSLLALGNAAGRIAWGWLFDRFGWKTIPASLFLLGLAVLSLLWAGLGWLFPVAVVLIGFGFGAYFVVYAAQIAAAYGPEEVGRVYPLVFLAYGFSGIVGPFIGGWFFDLYRSYTGAILTAAILSFSGGLAAMALFSSGFSKGSLNSPERR